MRPIAPALAVTAALTTPPARAESPVSLDQTPSPWADAIELVPPVRLPVAADGDSRIRIFLRLPPQGSITAEDGPASLTLPAGARLDRVEYVRSGDDAPWTVIDVRGTRLTEDGQRFHALRPVDARLHAPLKGAEWARGQPQDRRAARDRMAALLRRAARPPDQPPLGEAARERYLANHDCARCHRARQPTESHLDARGEPARPTDAHGFYALRAVLSDEGLVCRARPRDLNVDDPFVTARCGDSEADVVRADGVPQYDCPGDRVPVGRRAMARGVEDGDAYTLRVCASRRALAARMDAATRARFAAVLDVCPSTPDDG